MAHVESRQLSACSRLVLIVELLAVCTISACFWWRDLRGSPINGYIVLYGVLLAALAIGLGLCQRLATKWRLRVGVVVFGCALAVYGAEMLALLRERSRWNADNRAESIEQTTGETFDRRSRAEMVESLRAEGEDAFTTITPAMFFTRHRWGGQHHPSLFVGGRPTVPLATVSGVTTVLGNESGQWVTFRSDEHGFRNAPGLWKPDEVDVMIAGDSFAQGYAVGDDEDIMSVVRRAYPRSLNLGTAGVGPVSLHAYLREFAMPMRPRRVLWLLCEANDVSSLEEEKTIPFLMRYLDEPGFGQNLIGRQGEIDSALRDWLPKRQRPDPTFLGELIDFATLRRLCWRLPGARNSQPADFELLRSVMKKCRDMVGSWGGRFAVVYLPSWLLHRDEQGRAYPSMTYVDVVRTRVRGDLAGAGNLVPGRDGDSPTPSRTAESRFVSGVSLQPRGLPPGGRGDCEGTRGPGVLSHESACGRRRCCFVGQRCDSARRYLPDTN